MDQNVPKESVDDKNKKDDEVKETSHDDDDAMSKYEGIREERRNSLETAFKHTMDLFF